MDKMDKLDKMDNKLSFGINVSIILTLGILTGLLVLPLKLLLDTNYETQVNNESIIKEKITNEIIDFKKFKLCPGKYKFLMDSVFLTNYDGNCTYTNNRKIKNAETAQHKNTKIDKTDNEIKNSTNSNISTLSFSGLRIIKPKSVPVTDYILVILLTVSVIGAFLEFLRIRFINTQDESSSVEGITSRRQSIVDLMLPRKRMTRDAVKTQMSLDVPGSQRSTIRVSGSRAPPLIRRSSFPVYYNLDNVGSDSLTPPRSPRRPSVAVNADSEIGTCTSPVLHHRSRLIRRH